MKASANAASTAGRTAASCAWELLSGRRAAPKGDLAAKVGWHLGVGVPDVRTVRADCPVWLAEVVATLGAKEASARPVDGAAALASLPPELGTVDGALAEPEPGRSGGSRKVLAVAAAVVLGVGGWFGKNELDRGAAQETRADARTTDAPPAEKSEASVPPS